MNAPIINLSWLEVAGAGGLALIAVGISWRFRTELATRFVVAALRTVVQLALVGCVLVYIFSMDRWWLVLPALLFMVVVAAREAAGRQERPSRRLTTPTPSSSWIPMPWRSLPGRRRRSRGRAGTPELWPSRNWTPLTWW